ncbi:alpha/beta hydrolase family protein [Lentzea indica]|uniref:alpha/beta hydrolase family protein n=1 Tax=Lentzea indica TaxID=2604800 RepID=UPI0035E40FFE
MGRRDRLPGPDAAAPAGRQRRLRPAPPQPHRGHAGLPDRARPGRRQRADHGGRDRPGHRVPPPRPRSARPRHGSAAAAARPCPPLRPRSARPRHGDAPTAAWPCPPPRPGLLARVTGAHRPRGGQAHQLGDIPWGSQERLHYQASDGLDLDGLLVLPVGKTREDGPFRLVTLVHGGPYDRWTDDLQLHWVPSAQWFAHQGIASFLPNPRGGLGHGHEFAAAVAGRVGQEEWHDIETGIDLLIAQNIADPDRLGIAGWSHGGFMAAWATTRTDRFKAALVGAGISDWPRQVATGEWGAFEAALGDSPEHSPITYADRIRTPLLIVHGADDTNVPVEQAELLHRAVEHSELIIYPGEGHSLRKREHRLDLLNRARRLFAKL